MPDSTSFTIILRQNGRSRVVDRFFASPHFCINMEDTYTALTLTQMGWLHWMAWTVLRSPGSFSGVDILRRHTDWSEREAKEFLAKRDAYTLHKPRIIRFPRRKMYSKGTRYLLTCIDVLAVPIRTKSGTNVATAFEKILTDARCNKVQSDKGTEFLNSDFQSML